jgi:hypothetical protein
MGSSGKTEYNISKRKRINKIREVNRDKAGLFHLANRAPRGAIRVFDE